MHPDMAREIIRLRTGEMRAQAKKDGYARAARVAARDQRAAAKAAEAVRLPRIPDYVDDTFRPAAEQAPGDPARAC